MSETNKERQKSEREQWLDEASRIDCAEAQHAFTAYGDSGSWAGREIYVDCGNALGDIALVRLMFRNKETARAAYCKRLKIEIKVVDRPEGA